MQKKQYVEIFSSAMGAPYPLQEWEKQPEYIRFMLPSGKMVAKRPNKQVKYRTFLLIPRPDIKPKPKRTPQEKSQRIVAALSDHNYTVRQDYTSTVFPYRKSVHGPNCAEHRGILSTKSKAMARDRLKEAGIK